MLFRPLSTIVEVGNSRTVENSDGLKLVISVEKSVNHSNELLNDGNVETTSDYIEEDVALPDSRIFVIQFFYIVFIFLMMLER